MTEVSEKCTKNINSSEEVQRIFTYGTLREDGSNRHYISDAIETTTPGTIKGDMYYYTSQPGGKGNFPFLTEGEGTAIGEILTFYHWENCS